jgi:hypothetical protein
MNSRPGVTATTSESQISDDKISFIPGKAPGLRIIWAICLPETVREGVLWRD